MIQVGKRMRRARRAKYIAQPSLCVAVVKSEIARLKYSRDQLRDAGAFKAADAVRRALKSAEGALRHAERAEPDRVEAGGGVR